MNKINYLDLFSGIGGFRLGLEMAGFEFEWEGHSEIDKYAEKVYQKHFSKSIVIGDINELISRIGHRQIDIVTFGFPCQDLSIAGKKLGLIDGIRSSLFFKAIKIIRYYKPRVFIFENVKGLLSSNNRRDFETVLRTIADIGLYDCEWQLLNTKWFLPQNRERVYFVGHLAGTSGFKIFPITETDFSRSKAQRDNENKGKRLQKNVTATILARDSKDGGANLICTRLKRGVNNSGSRIYEDFGIYSTLKATGEMDAISSNNLIRKLTPIEIERLQGFPDNWTDCISENNRYKCIGNAVSVPCVRFIGQQLLQNGGLSEKGND